MQTEEEAAEQATKLKAEKAGEQEAVGQMVVDAEHSSIAKQVLLQVQTEKEAAEQATKLKAEKAKKASEQEAKQQREREQTESQAAVGRLFGGLFYHAFS